MIKKNIRIHTVSEIIALTVLYPGYHYNIGGYKMSENTDINLTEWTDIMMSLRCHSPGNPLCIDRGRSQTESCRGSIWGYTSQSHCQAEHRGKNSVTKGMSNMYLSLTQDSLF